MLGSTVPTRGGIQNAFKWGDKWGCKAVQFYLTLSRQWKVNNLTDKDVKDFKSEWKKSGVEEVVAHVPYLVNLTSVNKETRKKSIERMSKEIKRAERLGVKYLVLHPGSPGKDSKTEGFKRIKVGFDEVFKEVGNNPPVEILIETMSGKGNMIGSNFKEIKEILDLLGKDLFNVCIDTAHLFQAGYDIKNNWDEVLNEFEKHISLERIKAFHLNDSKRTLGSHKDRHQQIGKGKIGLNFFKKLVKDERFKSIPMILETPNIEEKAIENLEILRSLR